MNHAGGILLLLLSLMQSPWTDELDCSRENFLPKKCNAGNDWTTVECQTDALDTNFQLQAVDERSRSCLNAITALDVVCTTNRRATFSSPAPFGHLPNMVLLRLYRCCVSELRPDDLAGLDQLIMVEVDGDGNCEGNEGAAVRADTFRRGSSSTDLTYVGMMSQGVRALPPGLHCDVMDMVDLSWNRLAQVADIGLVGNGNSSLAECGGGLYSIILTGNRLAALPDGGFGHLDRLVELQLDWNRLESIAGQTWRDMPALERLNISGNRLNSLEGRSFSSLVNLRNLQLGYNRLHNVDEAAFDNLSRLLTLSLQGNLIENVTGRMWRGTTALTVLNLAANRLNGSVERTQFEHLDNLTSLNLSGNRFEAVDSLPILLNLTQLDLSGNNISRIQPGVFRTTPRLQSLLLSSNRLRSLVNTTFMKLYALQVLYLDYNGLTDVESHVFRFCPFLTTLSLHHNQLVRAPNLSWLKNIVKLHLSHNAIASLAENYFSQLTKLTYVSLGNNRLTTVPDGLFLANIKLETLHLYGNQLVDLWNMTSLIKLANLELQNNSIVTLHIQKLQRNIRYLNLSNCLIEAVTGRMYRITQYKLTHLDLSGNRLRVAPNNFNFLVEYDLSRNNLSIIAVSSFANTATLKLVDLRHNRQLAVQRGSFLVAKTKAPTTFLLEGLPFRCDCHTRWLLDINNNDFSNVSSAYGTVGDLDRLMCTVPVLGSTEKKQMAVVDVPYNSFLCEFGRDTLPDIPKRANWTADTGCPKHCHCYVNYDWSFVVTYCSRRNLTFVPAVMPIDSAIIYMDGNKIKTISQTDFVNHTYVKELYLNRSEVENIQDGAFHELKGLAILRLDNNRITRFSPDSFVGCFRLKELHFQSNQLVDAAGGALFSGIFTSLLRLDNNRLKKFPPFDFNASIKWLMLSGNPWRCDCSAVNAIQQVTILDSLSSKLVDRNQTTCANLDNSAANMTLFQFYSGYCNDVSFPPQQLAAALVPAVALVVVGIVAVIVFIYRYEMQVLLYSRYRFRLLRRWEKEDEEADHDKVFDAFIAYSELDETFVARELVPKLEGGEHPFRLCLHQRNFLVGGLITNSILEAVECSRRTIVVMSDNFASSHWCRFEFKAAHVQSLEDRRNRLIMVVLNETVPNNLDPEANLYFKTNTYLRHGDRLFWKKLEYAMPRRRNTTRTNEIELERTLKGLYTT